MISVDILDVLTKKVWAKQVPVIGCVRQHVLAPDKPWRYIRGNAILACIGEKVTISAPFGEMEIWLFQTGEGSWILQFRGGQESSWWSEDSKLLSSLVATYSTLKVLGVVMLSELDGQLRINYIETPAEAELLSKEALDRWKNQSRLNRQSPRATYLCPKCPVLKTCMAMDMEKGETSDWPDKPLQPPISRERKS